MSNQEETIKQMACDIASINTGITYIKASVDLLSTRYDNVEHRLTIIETKADDAKDTSNRVRNWTIVCLSIISTIVGVVVAFHLW